MSQTPSFRFVPVSKNLAGIPQSFYQGLAVIPAKKLIDLSGQRLFTDNMSQQIKSGGNKNDRPIESHGSN